MKISYKFFTKYITNISIVLMFVVLGTVAFQGGAMGVFNTQNPQVYFCGNTKKNNISLMFNVYGGNEYVEKVLDILKDKNVKSTFFVGGIWVNKNEDCFLKIYNSGNEIASHGYWHKDHSKITDEEQANEIIMTDELIYNLTGIKMGLFAPPSGAYNKNTALIAHNLNYKTIMWSKDTIDWRDQNTDLIISRATNKLSNGDLILMHPTKCTCEALPQIIDTIIAEGYNLTNVGENIE